MEADVLVIGGGPSGLAAAIASARAGLRVELAEPRAGVLDKCCGEGLLPLAVASLGELGIPASRLARHGARLEGIQFRGGRSGCAAQFRAEALGVRRTVLHTLLQEQARAAGVQLLGSGARLVGDGQDGEVRLLGGARDGELRRVRWVVGADGAMSAARTAAGLDGGRAASRRFAIRQHFQLAGGRALPGGVEVHWARGAQAYVTPLGGGSVGVAVVSGAKLGGMTAALAQFPALRDWLGDAEACSAPRGAVSIHRTLRAVFRGPVALVGDASGSVDAVTGDGLSLAFAQALSLGAALRAGDLRMYARAHTRLMRAPRLMSRALLAMGAAPALTRTSLELLEHTPGLFAALLTLHTGRPQQTAAREGIAPWPLASPPTE